MAEGVAALIRKVFAAFLTALSHCAQWKDTDWDAHPEH